MGVRKLSWEETGEEIRKKRVTNCHALSDPKGGNLPPFTQERGRQDEPERAASETQRVTKQTLKGGTQPAPIIRNHHRTTHTRARHALQPMATVSVCAPAIPHTAHSSTTMSASASRATSQPFAARKPTPCRQRCTGVVMTRCWSNGSASCTSQPRAGRSATQALARTAQARGFITLMDFKRVRPSAGIRDSTRRRWQAQPASNARTGRAGSRLEMFRVRDFAFPMLSRFHHAGNRRRDCN